MGTKEFIKNEFLPPLPFGVSKAWTVAAYGSGDGYLQEAATADPDRHRGLAGVIAYHFLTPAESDPEHELLKRAVDLVAKDDFRRKRAAFYAFQEDVIQNDISDNKAIEELQVLLKDYNEATRKAFISTVARYVFLMIPMALAMVGVLIPGKAAGLVLVGTGGPVEFTKFRLFERKPSIEAGELDAAAMIHDARKKLPLVER
ncbi:MAG TPA: hypothetical protein VKS22_01475 [Candidatus Binataceae bacterium]|nr:hypothetical protein [Candidatus Binataceae bacterium]